MADETESDDEWYTQMEEAAFATPCDEVMGGTDELVNNDDCVVETEEEYYERMNTTNCTVSDSIFQSEKSSVWYNLMQQSLKSQQDTLDVANSKSRCWDLTKLDNSDKIAIDSVSNFLFGNLPKSSHLCGIVANLATTPFETLFVDHLVHPSIVVSFKVVAASRTLEVSCYASINSRDVDFTPISRIMTQMLTGHDLTEVHLSGFESSLYDAFKTHDCHFNEIWTDICGLYANLDNVSSGGGAQAVSLPSHYSFHSLSDVDADIINSTWKYKTKHSINMVREMIHSQRCVGVRYTPSVDTPTSSTVRDSQLVAWCLTYRYGAIGMLYTLEEHRKKGLANAVVRELLSRSSSSHSHGAPPFCYIESSNEASQRLFCGQLGFARHSHVLWVGLKPRNKMSMVVV